MMGKIERTKQHGITWAIVVSIKVVIYLPLDMENSKE